MTKRRVVVPLDDDFLRDVDPEELERRRMEYEAAKAESPRYQRRVAAEKPAS